MARRARARGRTAPDRRAGSQSGTLSALVVFVVMALSRMVRLVACSPMDVTGERARARRARKISAWFPCSGPHGHEQQRASAARRSAGAPTFMMMLGAMLARRRARTPLFRGAVRGILFFRGGLGIAAAGATVTCALGSRRTAMGHAPSRGSGGGHTKLAKRNAAASRRAAQPPVSSTAPDSDSAMDAQSRSDPAEYERKVLREKGE